MTRFATTIWAVAALCSSGAAIGEPRRGETELVRTTLTAIRQTPESFKGVAVAFRVQFAAIGELQNPFFTRFVASDFTNFYAWADDQPIWRREEYDNVFGLMFLSKEHQQLDQVFRLKQYDRLDVRAVVRHTFQGMPWIEVTSFQPVDGKVNTATLSHLYRGEQLMAKHEWSQAISELSLAPAADVPSHVQSAVHKNIGLCHLRLGDQEVALKHLDKAMQLSSASIDAETERLMAVARAKPDKALDRTVNRRTVREHQRPLWEAFFELEAADKASRLPAGAQPRPQG
jgi:hypothetical protein